MTTTLQRYAAGEDQCGAGHSKAYYMRQVQDARRYAHIVDEDRRYLSEMLSQKQEEIDTLHALLAELETGAMPARLRPSQEDAASLSAKIIPVSQVASDLVEAVPCS
jgi:hypothetical protein